MGLSSYEYTTNYVTRSPRKLMVKVITKKLTNLCVEHRLLNNAQFAALPGGSTLNPIQITNELIEDAKDKNSELWILFQDMAKCYDHVNVYMLEKAFLRLRLPQTFI